MGTVTGKVTMDGAPLPNALVTFTPTGGGSNGVGRTDANGQYILVSTDQQGALIGQHKVSVTSIQEAAPVAEISSDDPAYAAQAAGGESSDYKPFVEKIPAKYNANTELTKEVKSGANTIDLELTSK